MISLNKLILLVSAVAGLRVKSAASDVVKSAAPAPDVVKVRLGKMLHRAIEKGSLEEVEFLVEDGADVEAMGTDPSRHWKDAAKFKDECTPLHLAAGKGHLKMVEFLVKSGADVEARDGMKNTPLILAAAKGHLEVVKYLVQNDADKDAIAHSVCGHRTALMAAVGPIIGHPEVVKFLVRAGAAWKRTGSGALVDHAALNNLELVQFLVQNGANVSAKRRAFGGRLWTVLDRARTCLSGRLADLAEVSAWEAVSLADRARKALLLEEKTKVVRGFREVIHYLEGMAGDSDSSDGDSDSSDGDSGGKMAGDSDSDSSDDGPVRLTTTESAPVSRVAKLMPRT